MKDIGFLLLSGCSNSMMLRALNFVFKICLAFVIKLIDVNGEETLSPFSTFGQNFNNQLPVCCIKT